MDKRTAYHIHQKPCGQCGKTFKAARSTAKYCSDACRQRALYDKKHLEDRRLVALDYIGSIGLTGLNSPENKDEAHAALMELEKEIMEWRTRLYRKYR
jgi:hypothetical protein